MCVCVCACERVCSLCVLLVHPGVYKIFLGVFLHAKKVNGKFYFSAVSIKICLQSCGHVGLVI